MSETTVEQVMTDTSVPSETPTQPIPDDQTKESKTESGQEPAKDDDIDKKFENLKSRLKSEKRAMRAQFTQREQQLLAELTELKAKSQPQQTNRYEGPREDDKNPDGSLKYQTYGEFLQAEIEYKVKQAMAANQPKQESQVSVQEQVWIAKREEAIGQQAEELLKSNPEYQEILEDNSEVLDVMPPHIERAFLEADNAPLAFIALAQEGKLADLLTMSPQKAAMEIAKAEIRGEAMVKAKKVTKAPAPMTPNKGSATIGARLENMSGDDILKAMRG